LLRVYRHICPAWLVFATVTGLEGAQEASSAAGQGAGCCIALRFSVPGSQFLVLSSWFLVPQFSGSRFLVLVSQFSVLGSQFSVLSSWFSVLSSQFSKTEERAVAFHEQSHPSPVVARRTALLVIGDALALLIFAALGRASHGEAAGLTALAQVAETAGALHCRVVCRRSVVRHVSHSGDRRTATDAGTHGADLADRLAHRAWVARPDPADDHSGLVCTGDVCNRAGDHVSLAWRVCANCRPSMKARCRKQRITSKRSFREAS
jgi:hypothetical protein